jgi:hypothetical protein
VRERNNPLWLYKENENIKILLENLKIKIVLLSRVVGRTELGAVVHIVIPATQEEEAETCL